jgi:hypothetical protein
MGPKILVKKKEKSLTESPTEYTVRRIKFYKKVIKEGGGRSDLEKAETYGLDTSVKLEFFLWKILNDWIEKEPRVGKNISEIEKLLMLKKDSPIWEPFDRTYINHCMNKLVFLGILKRKLVDRVWVYIFEPTIIQRGLTWYRKGNRFMRGEFQDRGGFFTLV